MQFVFHICPCQEYNVRASSTSDKSYFIGRFVTGLPNFSKKKNAENKWSIQKEGIQGRQYIDAVRVRHCSYLFRRVATLDLPQIVKLLKTSSVIARNTKA